ncbi:MFS transporter [Streptacidiphilus sp. P02-A3a]|uniref:MFS transporter n=1 Tax=Streptacidiphilus sp. P02-A3a TaxID=2704468 RepID=UPI0015FD2CE6|nr:MFS transporter [Streptacidiphilus sp. P02-A3a]QMU67158.1 MFS transporter [Streptacidiphilus sp. P02-A3a]
MTPTRTTRLLPSAYRPLLAHATFRRLLPAMAVSDFGDGMSAVAVAWLAILIAPPGRAGLLLGAAVAAYSLPGVVGALVLGRRLRRVPARRLLVANASLRALCLGCVPLAWAAGLLNPVLYVVLLGGSSLLSSWGSAGKYGLLGQLLVPELRLAANALVSSSSSAAMVLGPAVAGLLVAGIGPAWIIGLNALSFAVLALQVGRLALAAAPAAPTADHAGSGLRLLRGQPELLGIIALTWAFNFLYGPVEVALPLHVSRDLHAGAGLLGLYWACFGVGAVLGSLAVGGLRRLPLWPVTLGIVAGWGVVLLPVGLAVPTAVSLGCFALGGLIYGPFNALSFTLFQQRTPAALLTTVLAVRGAALLTSDPIGTALGGPLTSALGAGPVLVGSALATVLLAVGAAVVATVVRAGGGSALTPGRDAVG